MSGLRAAVTTSAVIAAVACLVTTGASAAAMRHYVNARFGFAVDVPSELVADRPPDNGDGRAFHAPDGSLRVTMSGIGNVLGETLSAFVSPEMAHCAHQPPDYLLKRSNWIVFSCTASDGIVYQKTIQRGRGEDAVFVSLRIHYPVGDKARWNDVVTQISNSLRLTSSPVWTR